MLLKRLELINYRQHENRTVDFHGHIIGVVGENGSGKTHLLEAINFALAGKIAGGNKSDMIRWGAGTGSVRLIFEHEGEEGAIYRELHSSEALYSFRNDNHKGITAVNAAIAQDTGIDAELCNQAIFARQKHIDAILFTEPSERQIAWQRLCGLGEARGVHVKLGQRISALPEITDYSEQIAEAAQRLTEKEADLADLNTQLTGFEAKLGGQTSAEVADRIQKLTGLNNIMSAAVTLNRKLTECKGSLAAQRTQHDELKAKLPDTEDKSAEIEKLVSQIANAETNTQAQAALLTAQGELDTLKGMVEESKVTQEDIDKLREDSKKFSAEMAGLENDLNLYSVLAEQTGLENCPACGQDILDSEAVCTRAQERVDTITAAQSEAGDKYQQASTDISGMITRKRQQEELDTSIAAAVAKAEALQTTAGTDKPVDVSELKTTLSQLKAVQQQIAEHGTQMAALGGQITQGESTVADLDKEVGEQAATIQATIKELNIVPTEVQARITELTATETALRDAEANVSVTKGAISQAQLNLTTLRGSVDELREKQEGQSGIVEVHETLTKVRDWFHYSKGPQVVINSLFDDIAAGTNDFLGKFESKFAVIPDKGTMSFRYYYHDGRIVADGYPPAEEMSGGEQIVTAVSFRFASYCLFAQRVGLLSLDEPTVYLDHTNVDRFCQLLTKVRELATKMNLQILLSTHERSVIPNVDTLIDLNPESEGVQSNEQNHNVQVDG